MGSFPTVCIIFRPEFQNLLLQTWQAIPLLHLWTIFPQDIVVYCSGSCSPASFCRFFNKCSWQCQHSIGVQYIPLVAAFSYTLITRQHHCCELLACQLLCWSVFIPCNYLAASTCQLDWTERVHVFLLIDVSLILLSPRYWIPLVVNFLWWHWAHPSQQIIHCLLEFGHNMNMIFFNETFPFLSEHRNVKCSLFFHFFSSIGPFHFNNALSIHYCIRCST